MKACLVTAGITPKARHALETMAARELKVGMRLDWSTSQVGKGGGCDRRTMDRNIEKLLERGLIEITEEGSHALRKATLYRLTRLLPTFQSQLATPSQRAECPSPGELRSKKTSITAKPNIQNTQGDVPTPVNVPLSTWEGSREEILQALTTLGKVGPKGFRDAEAVSPFVGHEALLVANAAVAQVPSNASGSLVGWVLAALKNEAFGRSLLAHKAQAEAKSSPWGGEVAAVEAKLEAIPADPGGIASARKESWCDGSTALRVIEGCKAHWEAGNLAENPGGYVVAALKGQALGEAMLALVQGGNALGSALQTYRQLDRKRREHWRKKPEESWLGWRPLWEALQNLAVEVRQALPGEDVEAAVQDLAHRSGFRSTSNLPTSLEARGVLLAGIRAGLLTGWDLQAMVDIPGDGPERTAA